jgi:hypothetical protein
MDIEYVKPWKSRLKKKISHQKMDQAVWSLESHASSRGNDDNVTE